MEDPFFGQGVVVVSTVGLGADSSGNDTGDLLPESWMVPSFHETMISSQSSGATKVFAGGDVAPPVFELASLFQKVFEQSFIKENASVNETLQNNVHVNLSCLSV